MSDILDESKRLLAERTQGEWSYALAAHGDASLDWPPHEVLGDPERVRVGTATSRLVIAGCSERADAALIARAPTLIAELVAMVEARDEAVKRIDDRSSGYAARSHLAGIKSERERIVKMLRELADRWRRNGYTPHGDLSADSCASVLEWIANELERSE